MNVMDRIQKAPLRRDLPPFRPGDTVRVHVRVTEGDKQRIQVFEGVVLRRRGRGPSATFTVRKISSGATRADRSRTFERRRAFLPRSWRR